MKTWFLVFLISSLYCSKSFSQNLTSKDLQHLLISQLDELDIYLSKKGFTYSETNELNASCKLTTWKMSSIRDIYLLGRSFCQEPETNFVTYSFYNKEEFDKLKNEIVKKGYKLEKSIIDEKNTLVAIYTNSTYYLKFNNNGDANHNIFSVILGYINFHPDQVK